MVSGFITLWLIASITFILMHILPGSPLDTEKNLNTSIHNNLENKLKTNESLKKQYLSYIKNIVHGNLGTSLIYDGKSVNDIIENSFPVSASIGMCSITFAVILGLFIGIQAAVNKDKWQDTFCLAFSTFTMTIPNFIMAVFLIYLFAVKLKFFPAVGLDSPQSYILPVIALTVHPMAFISKLIRNSMLNVLEKDYIMAARAKGMPQNRIIYKLALRNAVIPVVSYISSIFAFILTGSFAIESIFGIHGLGKEFIQSIYNRDYTVILGITIFYSAIYILSSLLVDIIYIFIDPRIELPKS